jgi:hypothetical protein
MSKKYYKYAIRPVYSEEKPIDVVRFYAYQWDSGEFKEDFSYSRKIFHDLSGEAEEVTKQEFDNYVEELRKKLKEKK